MKRDVSLDAGALVLIEQASPEPPPSDDACRRMSLRLAPMLAAGAGSLLLKPSVELSDTPGRGAAAGAWRWERLAGSAWGKLAFGALTGTLMAGAFYLGSITSQRAKPVTPAVLEAVPTALMPVKSEPTGDGHEKAPEPVGRAEPAIVTPAPVPRPKPVSPSQRADGLAILGEVEVLLRRKNPGAALARLDDLDEPVSPRLGHLSRVLRAIALCDAGRLDEGRHLIDRLRKERGSSVFAARLETACGASSSEASGLPGPSEQAGSR